MYRNKEYDKFVAKKLLKSQALRRSYLLASIDDFRISPIEALRGVIKRMGINEFSDLAGLPRVSVSRFVNGSEVSKISTLSQYFAPFGLKVEISLKKIAS